MLTEREVILEDIEGAIADKICKAFKYEKIGKPTTSIRNEIALLKNFKFLLCGYDVTGCEDLSCISCKVYKYIN